MTPKDNDLKSKKLLNDEDLENVSGGNTYFWQKGKDGHAQCFHMDRNDKPNSWVLYGPSEPAGPGRTIAKPIKTGKGTGWEPNSGVDD